MNDKVLVEEIWVKTDKDNGTCITANGDNLKLVAYIVDGTPIILEKDYFMEKRHISQEEKIELLGKIFYSK
jgi:hypothetical protein